MSPVARSAEPFTIFQTKGLPHSVLTDELSLQHRLTSPRYLQGRALHRTSNKRAPPYNTHCRALPSTQAEEFLQLAKTSPVAHSMSPVAHSDELSLQHQVDELLHFKGRALRCTSKQTGSSLQSLTLTSSPFNISGRVPTAC